jgi:UDP-N-acetylglucosamine 4,6-dehydratase/5-epimerase
MQKSIAAALKGKRILVTGGTGSFGNEIVQALFKYDTESVHILSRDEKKQDDMRQAYTGQANLRFVLGDVRELTRVREVMRGVDIVFHAAALKQVPNTEYAPMEAVKTNILGAENVRQAALEAGTEVVVAISTDKAVKPVNVMGMSKAIQERIMLQPTFGDIKTRFVCVRYGNVLGSRGSVVPLFYNCLLQQLPLPITHPEMTRFILTLKEAVQLVLVATVKAESGDLWVRKMPASTVTDLGAALAYGLTGRKDYPQEIVGVRPGEKMHEVLVSEEEMWRATELAEHFLIPTWSKVGKEHSPKEGPFNEYASNGTRRLGVEALLPLLEAEGWFEKLTHPKKGL